MKQSIKKAIFIALLFTRATPTKPLYHKYAAKRIIGLYQLMKDTHELFVKHKIPYWAAAGTLLGAIRHKGIIPLDIDLDIFIDDSHEPLLVSIASEINALGYELVQKSDFIYKIEEPELNIHCDIILMYQEKNLIFYSSPKFQKTLPQRQAPLTL